VDEGEVIEPPRGALSPAGSGNDAPVKAAEIPAMEIGNEGFDDRELRSFVYTTSGGEDRQILVRNAGTNTVGRLETCWTPWYGFVALPGGVAYRLAVGTKVIAEIYYGPTDKRVVDEGRLGSFFADEPATALSMPSGLVLEASGVIPAFYHHGAVSV